MLTMNRNIYSLNLATDLYWVLSHLSHFFTFILVSHLGKSTSWEVMLLRLLPLHVCTVQTGTTRRSRNLMIMCFDLKFWGASFLYDASAVKSELSECFCGFSVSFLWQQMEQQKIGCFFSLFRSVICSYWNDVLIFIHTPSGQRGSSWSWTLLKNISCIKILTRTHRVYLYW